MSENLTLEVLREACAKLPPRRTDVIQVRYGNGTMALELPIDKIVPAVVSGLIEWDEASSAFYVTLRAEHELRKREP